MSTQKKKYLKKKKRPQLPCGKHKQPSKLETNVRKLLSFAIPLLVGLKEGVDLDLVSEKGGETAAQNRRCNCRDAWLRKTQ